MTEYLTARSESLWVRWARSIALVLLASCAHPLAPGARPDDADSLNQTSAYVSILRQQAETLKPLMVSSLGAAFMSAVEELPRVSTRRLYSTRERDGRQRTVASAEQWTSMAPERRADFDEHVIDGEYYYSGKWGSPLAYGRPLDLVGRAGLRTLQSKRVLDFGYGAIGHLFLLCSLGASVTAIDVDPILPHLYGGQHRGAQWNDADCPTLLDGHFPNDSSIVESVGRGYDFIVSKNVLKRGYIHPEGDRTPAIDLGVADHEFLQLLFKMLQPGGYVMIYNVTPPPNGPHREYRAWADGRSPFSESAWREAGFVVHDFDERDDATLRSFGRVFAWENVDEEIFATYTLAQRP